MIYLTSDLHGCFQAFKELLDYVCFNENDFLYIIGDVLGRGPEPIPLLQFVMAHKNMELLMGNHEQIFLWNMDKNTSIFTDNRVHSLWLKHSGPEVYEQYLALHKNAKKEVLNYLRKCPIYEVIGKNILVHAGIQTKEISYDSLKELMKQQKSDKMLWQTKEFYCEPMSLLDESVRVFFGHMFSLIIRQDRGEALDSTEIWKDKNRVGLDCGYAFGGKMVLYCLDTDDAHYLTSTGERYTRTSDGRKIILR